MLTPLAERRVAASRRPRYVDEPKSSKISRLLICSPTRGFSSEITRRAFVFAAVLHTGCATPLIVHGPRPMNTAGLSGTRSHSRSV